MNLVKKHVWWRFELTRDTVEGVVEGRGRGGGGKKKVVVEAHKFSLGWFGVVCGALGFRVHPLLFGLSPAPTSLFFCLCAFIFVLFFVFVVVVVVVVFFFLLMF